MKKIVIIGSNSFSGSNLVDFLLNKNFNVLGLSRSKEVKFFFSKYYNNKNLKNFKFKQIDIKNNKRIIKTIDKYRPDYIVNYSAQSMVSEDRKSVV